MNKRVHWIKSGNVSAGVINRAFPLLVERNGDAYTVHSLTAWCDRVGAMPCHDFNFDVRALAVQAMASTIQPLTAIIIDKSTHADLNRLALVYGYQWLIAGIHLGEKMTRLNKLKSDARRYCGECKHMMERFKKIQYQSDKRFVWRSRCTLCGASVDVQPHPQPNEIQIGGPAVAVNCTVPAK